MALSDALCLLGRHSENYLKGPKAFKEKRKPIWKGRSEENLRAYRIDGLLKRGDAAKE